MTYTKLIDNKRVVDRQELKTFYNNFYSSSMDLSEAEILYTFLFFLDAFFAEFKFEKQDTAIWKYGLRRVELHEKNDHYEIQFHNKVYFMNKISFHKRDLKDLCIGSYISVNQLTEDNPKDMTLKELLTVVMDKIRELW
jgi:hypothetical protein